MRLLRLQVTAVRNIAQADLQPSPGANILFGENGSGKTSVLEAVHLLSSGKSFRTPHIRNVIQHGAPCLRVFGEIDDGRGKIPVGIERGPEETRVRIGGETVERLSRLAALLPVQYIGPESHRLLEQGPQLRRQLLDWGVFHVEHRYLDHWQRFQQLLRQRNAALKDPAQRRTLTAWDAALVEAALAVTSAREAYLQRLEPCFRDFLDLVGSDIEIDWRYQRGWPEPSDYGALLAESLPRDIESGFTQYGPHRADLVLRAGRHAAREELSRGQQKALLHALRLAQAALLREETGRNCVVLLDDLPSELDAQHREVLLRRLTDLDAQLFITCVDPALLDFGALAPGYRLFHVEHGCVTEVV